MPGRCTSAGVGRQGRVWSWADSCTVFLHTHGCIKVKVSTITQVHQGQGRMITQVLQGQGRMVTRVHQGQGRMEIQVHQGQGRMVTQVHQGQGSMEIQAHQGPGRMVTQVHQGQGRIITQVHQGQGRMITYIGTSMGHCDVDCIFTKRCSLYLVGNISEHISQVNTCNKKEMPGIKPIIFLQSYLIRQNLKHCSSCAPCAVLGRRGLHRSTSQVSGVQGSLLQ